MKTLELNEQSTILRGETSMLAKESFLLTRIEYRHTAAGNLLYLIFAPIILRNNNPVANMTLLDQIEGSEKI